ncbi:hypothetical protein [Actinoplanes nipponensis]|uniref:hypothetical protein n=1 Tax=Actinoplanes nipponensis TaxID=135950 RepID=UPI001EF31386|nr:hypothetical protein [Actinoplanes nipponensis]
MPRSPLAVVPFVLLLAGTVAGCSHPSHQAATPSPAAAPSVSPAMAGQTAAGNAPAGATPAGEVASVDEPPGALTCGKAVRAVRDASLMQPGVIADIAGAAGTADAPVADAAQALSAAYTKAVAAHGTDAEPDAVAAVSAAAAELVAICDDSGLATTG